MARDECSTRRAAWGAAALAGACGAALAQYSTGFEPPTFTGSAAGVPLNGQGGWYTPQPFNNDDLVCTYAGNGPGFTPPPGGGGTQFLLCHPYGNPARGEYPHDFTDAGTLVFTYDEAIILTGTPTFDSALPISSFALMPLSSRYFFAQNRYEDINNTQLGWDAAYLIAPAEPGGSINLEAPNIPGPAWQHLQFNHWYRQSTTIDFPTNRITTVSITDLVTGQATTVHPDAYYLNGGTDPSVSGLSAPTILRLSGNNDAVNNTAFDNFSFTPAASPCYANCDGSTVVPFLNVNDFTCFLNKFSAGDSYANCDGSTVPPVLNTNDFICFLNRFAAGCSAP